MPRSRVSSKQVPIQINLVKNQQLSDSIQQIQPQKVEQYEEYFSPSHYVQKQKKVRKNQLSDKQRRKFRKILMQKINQKKIDAFKALKMNVENRKLKSKILAKQQKNEPKEKQQGKFGPQRIKPNKIASRIDTPQTLILFQRNRNNDDIEVGDQFQVFEDKNVFGNYLFQKDCKNNEGIDNDVSSSYSQINQGIYYQMNSNVWKTLQNHGDEYMKKFDPPRVFYDCLFKLIHKSCMEYTNYFFKNYKIQNNLQPEIRKIAKNAVLEFIQKKRSQFEMIDAEQVEIRSKCAKKQQTKEKTIKFEKLFE